MRSLLRLAGALTRAGGVRRKVDRLLFGRAMRRLDAARAHAGREAIDAALDAYEAAVSACAWRADWLSEYGRFANRSGRWAVAERAFDRAIAARPEIAGLYVARARARTGLGRHAEAVADHRRAVELEPGRGERLMALGKALVAAGEADAARAAYERLADRPPADAESHALRARALVELDRDEAALEACRASLGLDAGQVRLHALAGRLLARRGAFEAAAEHLERAVAIAPGQPDLHADLDQFRQLAAAGESGATLGTERGARWYDAFYSASEAYREPYEASAYWPVWSRILARLADRAPPAIMEIGCGPGQLAQAIRDRGLASGYLGLDFSAEAIGLARANVPEFEFAVGDAFEAPEVDACRYDLVICTEMLEHVERDFDVIRRWRAGAEVIATVPNYDSASHVRHFADVDQVRARYAPLIEGLEVEPVEIGNDTCLYLMCGSVAARRD